MITRTIAIIGAITGCLALIVQALEYFNKRPKIICHTADIYDSYWIEGSKLQYINTSVVETEINQIVDIIVLSLVISNKRSIPITIEGFYKEKNIPIINNLNFEDPTFAFPLPGKAKNLKVTLFRSKNVILPHRLNGYDSMETSIAFIADKGSQPIKNFKIHLKTSYKTYNFPISVDHAENHAKHKKLGLIEASLEKHINDEINETNK